MLLLSSSGTTGRAKLVQLSESNVAFNVDPIYGLLAAFSCVLCGFPMLPMAEGFTLDGFYRAV